MAQLFLPLQLRNLKIKNRIFMPPMCQYSATGGIATPWHLAHYGARAADGVGLIIMEATGVSPEGRISPNDVGLWNEEQAQALKPIVEFIKSQGTIAAIQLAHAGRKASVQVPWKGQGVLTVGEGGWQTVAPSAIAFDTKDPKPLALDASGMKKVEKDFLAASARALNAGFDSIEIHMAHGYLLHEFLSPLSNLRKDEYGGSLENRMRFPLQIAEALRKFWPQEKPVLVRISATDWATDEKGVGWDLEQSIVFCRELKKIGIDFIDVSTGGLVPYAKIPAGPNFQVPFAEEIKKQAQIPVGAVGGITDPHQTEKILVEQKADVVLIGRELLRNPYWPLQAAKALAHEVQWPLQYLRAKN